MGKSAAHSLTPPQLVFLYTQPCILPSLAGSVCVSVCACSHCHSPWVCSAADRGGRQRPGLLRKEASSSNATVHTNNSSRRTPPPPHCHLPTPPSLPNPRFPAQTTLGLGPHHPVCCVPLLGCCPALSQYGNRSNSVCRACNNSAVATGKGIYFLD